MLRICKVSEVTKERIKTFEPNTYNEMNEISSKPVVKRKCKFCGEIHDFKKDLCPAFGKHCSTCKRKNHTANVCKYNNKRTSVKQVETKVESSDSEDNSDNPVFLKEICTVEKSAIMANLKFIVNGKTRKIKCQLDTGSERNVMGINFYKKLTKFENPVLKSSLVSMFLFTGNKIKVFGSAVIRCKVFNKIYDLQFEIVERDHIPLLSSNTCIGLGLITCKKMNTNDHLKQAHKLIEDHSNIFEGFGLIADNIELEIDDQIKPVIQTPRRFPLNYKKELKTEIENLVKEGIIKQEHEYTEWCSNILFPKRNNKRRLVLDPAILNTALKRPNNQFPKLEEILPEVGNCKVFSKVDLKKGYWQVKLTTKSSKLTTFWSPFGRYRFLRLPFGLSSSAEIFQMKLYEFLHDIPGIHVMADDILITGNGDNQEEAMENHNNNLEILLKRLEENNCKLNREKLVLCSESLTFFGHILSSSGVRPDPEKVDAIKRMPHPHDKSQ